MIAVDTNVLVYAHRRESNFHSRAFDCLKSLAEGAKPWGIPVSSGVAHWETLAELTRNTQIQGGQFHDARIAVICIENGVSVLWSADRDFGRFKTLKTLNPLV